MFTKSTVGDISQEKGQVSKGPEKVLKGRNAKLLDRCTSTLYMPATTLFHACIKFGDHTQILGQTDGRSQNYGNRLATHHLAYNWQIMITFVFEA